MKKLSLLILVISIGVSVLTSQDLLDYTLDAHFNGRTGLFEAEVEIRFEQGERAERFLRLGLNKYLEPQKGISPWQTLNSYGGFAKAWARVSKVSLDGQFTNPVPGVDDAVHLSLGILDVGRHVLKFSYSFLLPEAFNEEDSRSADLVLSRTAWFPYLMNKNQTEERIFPSFAVDLKLRVSKDWQLVLPTSVCEAGLELGESVWTYTRSERLVDLPFALTKSHLVLGVPLDEKRQLRIFYRPGTESAARILGDMARAALEWYAEQYFPLENTSIDLLAGGSGAWGKSSSGVIILGEGLFSGLQMIFPEALLWVAEHIVAHEIGHQYFGALTPFVYAKEPWLGESFAEYSTQSYLETKRGIWKNVNSPQTDILAGKALELLPSYPFSSEIGAKQNAVRDAMDKGWDYPLAGPSERRIANSMETVDYYKGTLVLQSLEAWLGSNLKPVLADWLRSAQGNTVTSISFEQAISKAAGHDVSPFFDRYVRGTEKLDLALVGTLNQKSGKAYLHTLEFVPSELSKSDSFSYTTTLRLVGKAPLEYLDFTLLSGQKQEFSTAFKVSYAVADPEMRLLDYNPSNNRIGVDTAVRGSGEYWLSEADAMVWGPGLHLDYTEMLELGYGITGSEKKHYSWGLAAYLGYPVLEALLGQDALLQAFNVKAWYEQALGPYTDLAFSTRAQAGFGTYGMPMLMVDKLKLSLEHDFYFQVPSGDLYKKYQNILDLVATAELSGSLGSQSYHTFETSLGLDLDYDRQSGSRLDFEFDFLVDLVTGTGTGPQLGISFMQYVPVLLPLYPSIKLAGRWFPLPDSRLVEEGNIPGLVLNDMSEQRLSSDNAEFIGQFQLGLPPIRGINVTLLNIVRLEKIAFAFVYEAAQGFDLGNISAILNQYRLQQELGVEILPQFRTIGGVGINPGLILVFDLDKGGVFSVRFDTSILPAAMAQPGW